MKTITFEEIAKRIVNNPVTQRLAVENIQRDPKRMAIASYSRGVYGRRWKKTIDKCLEKNRVQRGMLTPKQTTSLAMLVEQELKKLGYGYNEDFTRYEKKDDEK